MATETPKEGRFVGRRILVTGASSGLGAHLAAHLARQGASVAVAARRVEALENLAADVPGIHPVALDVADPESVADSVACAAGLLGGLDGLLNNAGIGTAGRAIEMTNTEWEQVINVNLSGVFRVAQAAAKAMTDGGAILNTASILGFGVQPGVAAYAASKAGVVHLTQALALEWARHGIRVNAIAPGYFPTDMNRSFLESPEGQAYLKVIPMRRFGRPEDLEGPVDLLLGPGGAYITGVTLPIDGGHLCRPL
ncbi:MAG: SDR family oxidoreductase [Pseudomonadota bacterium]